MDGKRRVGMAPALWPGEFRREIVRLLGCERAVAEMGGESYT